MNILMIFPEIPGAVGTGGQVRSWHFLKAAAAVARVTACVLPDSGIGRVEPGLVESFNVRVIQPAAGLPAGRCPRPGHMRSILRVLLVLALPWRQDGWGLMVTGQVNNVARARNERGLRFTIAHRLYAALLRGLAGGGRHFFRIDPPGALLHSDAWRHILPQVRASLHLEVPDVIWCEHTFVFPFAADLRREFPLARVICNAHNVECVLLDRFARNMVPAITRKWGEIEAAIMRAWECRMLRQADEVVCCSEPDAARLRELCSCQRGNVLVIPNGVDSSYFQVAPPSDGPPCLLFAGTGGYQPNDEAVAWLCEIIFPLIRVVVPDCCLLLAGRNAALYWLRWQRNDSSIEIASDVSDMRPWFRRAAVCVVPLLSGSGTRLKILEAMSSGRAVVSTTIGAEGIEGNNGTHWLLADTPQRFADAVVHLIMNRDARHIMERAGRDLVEHRYEWESLTDGIGQLIES